MYTPPATAGGFQTMASSQPSATQQGQSAPANVLPYLPYLAQLLSAQPGGRQAGGQQFGGQQFGGQQGQMQPQGFNFNDLVTVVNTAAQIADQVSKAGQSLGMLSAQPTGQQAGGQQGQMRPQGLFDDIAKTVSGVAPYLPYVLSTLSSSPTGQQADGQQFGGQQFGGQQGQMQPQGFDFNDLVKVVNTAAQVADQVSKVGQSLGMLSAQPTGQQAGGQQGQMQPQGLFGLPIPDPQQIINAANTAAQLGHGLGLFSSSPSGQQAGGQQLGGQQFGGQQFGGQQFGGQQGQMRPQGLFDDITGAVSDVTRTVSPFLPIALALLSASPSGQQAGGAGAPR
ncbi:hypothetical protein [Streptomyces soliscabiei]|uniref:hypothetical protein n=1 Tax=Streptomyces soliscabiei TaxID=588897 RepID=UPI0029AF5D63|nr:hypothetical protein [Streptomyces sp. NY05-11A]MDX2679940.1 hypothetical protein [Streptomyces sp. NY05-11A]